MKFFQVKRKTGNPSETLKSANVRFKGMTNFQKKWVSFMFLVGTLFLLYYSLNNIETYFTRGITDYLQINGVNSFLAALVFAAFSLFISEFIRPETFNIKINLAAVIGLVILLVLSSFLVSS